MMFWRSPRPAAAASAAALPSTYQFTNAGSYTLPENDCERPPSLPPPQPLPSPPPPAAAAAAASASSVLASAVTASNDKACTLRTLIYYAAVFKGTDVMVAEFCSNDEPAAAAAAAAEEEEPEAGGGGGEEEAGKGKSRGMQCNDSSNSFSAMAGQCLQHIPPLHTTFSYTTKQRRFICVMDGMFTYCSIMDEALSKADAFSFLCKLRDGFKSSLLRRGRISGSQNLTLGAHFLDEEMVSLMRNLVASLVGVPQRERNRQEAEQQQQQLHPHDIEEGIVEVDPDQSSTLRALPSASNHQDLKPNDSRSEEKEEEERKPHGSRSPSRMRLLSKLLMAMNQMKEVLVCRRNGEKQQDRGQEQEQEQEQEQKVEVLLISQESTVTTTTNKELHPPQKASMRWCNVKAVIMLDVLICLFLLAIWFGICHGISCVAK